MYRFFIKNYLSGPSTYSTIETEIYSVPINNPLSAFIDPVIKNEMGKAGSFEFGVHPFHPYFSSWLQMKTLLRVEYDNDTIFRGRVINTDNNELTGDRKIHAEGDLAFFLDSQVEGIPDDERQETTAFQHLQSLIANHNAQMAEEPDKQFVLGEVPGQYTSAITEDQRVKTDTRKYGSSSWQTTMSALESLQKSYGGFFRTRYQNGICYLDWLESYFRPVVHSQPMEVTENLIDISDTEDVDTLFTVLIPVGTFESKPLYLPGKYFNVTDVLRYCTVSQLNSGYHTYSDYERAFIDHGWIYKVVQFRDAETEDKLREYAIEYVLHNYHGGVKAFTITALDMHHIDGNVEKYLAGDRIPVIYPDADNLMDGHSGRVTRILTATAITYHPHDPDNNEYSIGIPSTLLSKDFSSTTSNKKLSSSKSSADNYASSGISSLQDWTASLPTDTYEVKQKVKNYDALAWAFIQDNTGKNYYQHNAQNNLISAYPNADADYRYQHIGWTMIHNKMANGYYGKFDHGYFTIDARGDQVKVYIRDGVEATNELKYFIPYLAAYLQSLKVGYEAYAAAHPGWPEESAAESVTTLLDGNGLNLLSSGLGSIKLPSGMDILGDGGLGFDISGASTTVTNLLQKLGIGVPGQDTYREADLVSGDNPRTLGYYELVNGSYVATHDDRAVPGKTYYERIPASNTLSEFDMHKVLSMSSSLTPLLDSITGKFSLDNLKKLLPSNLKNAIVNNKFTKAATDWLKQKFPILKYILGDGTTELDLTVLEEFVNGIPLLSPENAVTINADGGVDAKSGVTVGDGTATIGASGAVTLRSGLAALLDASGHVTTESFLAVFPKLGDAFVQRASVPTLTTAASNEVIKKFPELAGSVNANKRLTLPAIEAKIKSLIEEGKLQNTNDSTITLDPNKGSVNGEEMNLGNGTVVAGNGSITFTPTLANLWNSNKQVTRATILTVFPRLSSEIDSNGVISVSGSREIVNKFPELSRALNSSGQLTFESIRYRLEVLESQGKLPARGVPSVKISGDTGTVNTVNAELGPDASGEGKTVTLSGKDGSVKLGNGTTENVELNGWNGVQKVGKDAQGNWVITINEPITYTDSSGTQQTLNGAISAKDFNIPEIPSFKTKFAVIDELVAGKATIGQLDAAVARIGSLETNKLNANELEAKVANFGYLKTETLQSNTGNVGVIYTRGLIVQSGTGTSEGLVQSPKIAASSELRIGSSSGQGTETGSLYFRGEQYYDNVAWMGPRGSANTIFTTKFLSTNAGTKEINMNHAHAVTMTEETTGSNAGKVRAEIGSPVKTDSSSRISFFDIAASTTYKNGIAAALNRVSYNSYIGGSATGLTGNVLYLDVPLTDSNGWTKTIAVDVNIKAYLDQAKDNTAETAQLVWNGGSGDNYYSIPGYSVDDVHLDYGTEYEIGARATASDGNYITHSRTFVVPADRYNDGYDACGRNIIFNGYEKQSDGTWETISMDNATIYLEPGEYSNVYVQYWNYASRSWITKMGKYEAKSGGSGGAYPTGIFYSQESLGSGKAKIRYSDNTYSEYNITEVGSTPYNNM